MKNKILDIINDDVLLSIVTEFTNGILGDRDPKSMCFAVCLPLHSYLLACGYEVELIEGEIQTYEELWNHYWLEFKNGIIIDPTASQFKDLHESQIPKIYIGTKPSWYKVIS